MKIRRTLMTAGVILAAATLGGCSLAVPGAGKQKEADQVIGMFITREYLDGMQEERTVSIVSQEGEEWEEEAFPIEAGEEEKWYARIDKSAGEEPSDWEISFGMEGISFFYPVWEEEETSTVTACVSDNVSRIEKKGTGEEEYLSGRVYFWEADEQEGVTFFPNVVYQTADGRIYAVPSMGIGSMGDFGEGLEFGHQMEFQDQVTVNEEKKERKYHMEIQFEMMDRPVKITISQMNRENAVVKTATYRPGDLPERLRLEPDTEYLIVATEKESAFGEKSILREIHGYEEQAEEDFLSTRYPREDGTVGTKNTELEWVRTQ